MGMLVRGLTPKSKLVSKLWTVRTWKHLSLDFLNNQTINPDSNNPISPVWNKLLWNGTQFLALSDGQLALTSPDGLNWTPQFMPVDTPWYDVAWNGSSYCAIASSICASSPDGVTWTQENLPTLHSDDDSWESIQTIPKNDVVNFCVISNSMFAMSSDEISWFSGTLPIASSWTNIAYNNGMLCAASMSSPLAITTVDGINWNSRTLPNLSSGDNYQSMSYAPPNSGYMFAAISNSTIATSSDSISWSSSQLPSDNGGSGRFGGGWGVITNNGTKFCVIGDGSNCMLSNDGSSWTKSTLPVGNYGVLSFNGSGFYTISDGIDPNSANILVETKDGNELPIWVTVDLPFGTIGIPYSTRLVAQNATSYNLMIGLGEIEILPNGLTFNNITGEISGTIDELNSGSVHFIASANNSYGSVIRVFRLYFGLSSQSYSLILSSGVVGGAYQQQIPYVNTDPNSTPTYTISSGSLPDGLTLDSTTGIISGTVLNSDRPAYIIGVAINLYNPSGHLTGTISERFSIWVSPSVDLRWDYYTVSTSIVGESYHVNLYTVTDWAGLGYLYYNGSYDANTFSFSLIDGELPKGITLTRNGIIQGINREAPTIGLTAIFTVRVSDLHGNFSDNVFNIKYGSRPVIEDTTFPSVNAGNLYSKSINISYSKSCGINDGVLPTGLTMNSNAVISGTVSLYATTETFEVVAINSVAYTTKYFTITVIPHVNPPIWDIPDYNTLPCGLLHGYYDVGLNPALFADSHTIIPVNYVGPFGLFFYDYKYILYIQGLIDFEGSTTGNSRTFIIRASNSAGHIDKTFTINYSSKPVFTTPASNHTAEIGKSFTYTVHADYATSYSIAYASPSVVNDVHMYNTDMQSYTFSNDGVLNIPCVSSPDIYTGYSRIFITASNSCQSTIQMFDIQITSTMNSPGISDVIWVDFIYGSDTYPGTHMYPLRTICKASQYVKNNGTIRIVHRAYWVDGSDNVNGYRSTWDTTFTNNKHITIDFNYSWLYLNFNCEVFFSMAGSNCTVTIKNLYGWWESHATGYGAEYPKLFQVGAAMSWHSAELPGLHGGYCGSSNNTLYVSHVNILGVYSYAIYLNCDDSGIYISNSMLHTAGAYVNYGHYNVTSTSISNISLKLLYDYWVKTVPPAWSSTYYTD